MNREPDAPSAAMPDAYDRLLIFVECVSKDGFIRLAIPPAVSEAIARQRDALTGKVRSKAAKATAAARKAAGQEPGFMKNKRRPAQ
jgi:hypothetical protein